jgi:hypothetical protein
MDPDDATEWTIRNQRVRGWPENWILAAWWLIMGPSGGVVVLQVPFQWAWIAIGCWAVVVFIPAVIFLIRSYRFPRIVRFKLCDELRAYPFQRRLALPNITAIHISHDPDEDYAESKLPVPTCQVTVESRAGRRFAIIATAGDAARIVRWGRKKGIVVINPLGLASRSPIGSNTDG